MASPDEAGANGRSGGATFNDTDSQAAEKGSVHATPDEAVQSVPFKVAKPPTSRSHLFSLKNNQLSSHRDFSGFAGKMYNYQYKYPEDEFGQETAPEARLWKMNNDECELYDTGKIEAWRDALDVLLVFIGLFSAIVSAFLLEAVKDPKPDHSELTAIMIYTFLNTVASDPPSTTPGPFTDPNGRFTPSRTALWVNALWFTSLAISLSTGLLTVLTKQWLYHYMSPTSGSAQDRSRARHFRFAGLEKYHVPAIIDLLPIAVHIALALFLAGLVVFISTLSHAISWAVGIIASMAYVAYTISIVLPLRDPQCPYQSPFSTYIYYFKRRVLDRAFALLSVQNGPLHQHNPPPYGSSSVPQAQPSSLQELERRAIRQQANELDVDTVVWLYDTSSNSTVRDVIAYSAPALISSNTDPTKIAHLVMPYFDAALEDCTFHDEPLKERKAEYQQLLKFLEISVRGRMSTTEPSDEPISLTLGDLLLPRHTEPLTPGICMPLGIWRLWWLCVLGGLHDQHLIKEPLIIGTILSIDKEDNMPSAMPQEQPIDFTYALRTNTSVRSFIEHYLYMVFNIAPEPDGNDVAREVNLLVTLISWATTLAQSDSCAPQDLRLLLEACVKRLFLHADGPELSTRSKAQVSSAFESLLMSNVACDERVVSWAVLSQVVVTLAGVKMCHDEACSIQLMQALLRQLGRVVPEALRKDTHFAQFSDRVQRIITNWFYFLAESEDVWTLLDHIREKDLLRQVPTNVYQNHFWTYGICQAILVACSNVPEIRRPASLRFWLEYIDTPEHLFHLALNMLYGQLHPPTYCYPASGHDSADPDVQKRIECLLLCLPTSQNWKPCVEKLISVVTDGSYKAEYETSDKETPSFPEAVQGLKAMLHTLDWSDPRYDVPGIDDEETKAKHRELQQHNQQQIAPAPNSQYIHPYGPGTDLPFDSTPAPAPEIVSQQFGQSHIPSGIGNGHYRVYFVNPEHDFTNTMQAPVIPEPFIPSPSAEPASTQGRSHGFPYVQTSEAGPTLLHPLAKDSPENIGQLSEQTPLPFGWEERQTPDGRTYFENHRDQTTTWQDPRLPTPNTTDASRWRSAFTRVKALNRFGSVGRTAGFANVDSRDIEEGSSSKPA